MSESYRRPARADRAPKPPPDPDELDGEALARRLKKRAAVERRAESNRVEIANRQLKIAAGFALVLGLGAFALSAPMIGSGDTNRGLLRGLILGPALVGWSLFTLFTGTGGQETLAAAPTWIRAGQMVSPVVGALVGIVLAEL